MEADKQVKVRNTLDGRTGITYEPLHYKRVWETKDTVFPIPMSTLRELVYDPGCRYMFETGMLYIEDMAVKIELGLEPEGATEPTNIKIFTPNQMLVLIRMKSNDEFRDALRQMGKDQIQELANLAVKHGEISLDKSDMIAQAIGFDVMKTILMDRAAKEADKEAAKKGDA